MVSLPKSVFVCLKFAPYQEQLLKGMRHNLTFEGVDVPEYPCHITLTGTQFETAKQLREKIQDKANKLKVFAFTFEIQKFGLYPNTSVLSLIPHPAAGNLRWLQFELSRNIMPLNNSFEPENWRPHIALVKGLNTKEFRNAVVSAMHPEDWEPFSLTATAIGIKERGKHEDTYTIPLEGTK